MQVIIKYIGGILTNSFELLMDMSPYLVLGFFFAGILREFVSPDQIARHLGKSTFGSVLKAALFGIPLPLCSCGVIPPTMALRKAGASRGAVLSFLIATPTSGVDSIAATYSLLGLPFAIYRVGASFLAAIFSGITANALEKSREDEHLGENHASATQAKTDILSRSKRVLHYAFIELLSEIGKWLVIGILIGGVITFILPDDFFGGTLQPGLLTIAIMVLISVPIYVCATGSIPIAAALMMKGLNPGAAFVFLLAGPATNSVTITVISKFLGKRTTVIYLVTLILSSIGLGLLLDLLSTHSGLGFSMQHHHQHQLLPVWLEWSSAILLLILLIYTALTRRLQKTKARKNLPLVESERRSTLIVPNMTCHNCVTHVQQAVEGITGVENVSVDLKTKRVDVQYTDAASLAQISAAIVAAGYEVE
ncbi:permease [candidate division KSB1 bacterium]|nr:permease [candidate division KSB1 bacterium]